MDNLIQLIEQIKTKEYRISDTTRGEQIQQTDRNNLKKLLLQALKQDLKDNYDFVYQSEEGILLEIANDFIADNIKNEIGSGAITIAVDIKVMGLEHNAELESQNYEEEQLQKAEKKAESERKKKKKIASDKEMREKNKGE